MKAAVFHEPNKPMTIEDIKEPTPGPDDLILKVRNCGICGTDLHMTKQSSMTVPPNTVMGHEFSGEVYEVGKNLKGAGSDWKVGMAACALPVLGCGTCMPCLEGRALACVEMDYIGIGHHHGAYAEFVRVRANDSFILPEAVSYRQGALVEPLSVGLHSIHMAKLPPRANVLIIGAGPIGLAIALWARFFGVRNIVVSERAPDRIKMASKFGATAVIDPELPLNEQFKKETGTDPDVIFECVGIPGMLDICIENAPLGGKIMGVGVCDQPDTFIPAQALFKELQMQYVLGYRKQDFSFIIDMFNRGRLDALSMITDIVSFDGFADAFDALRTPGHQCKVMLEIS